MRADLEDLLRHYPQARDAGPRAAGHPLSVALGRVRQAQLERVRQGCPQASWIAKASTGMGATWASVAWVGLMIPSETTSAKRGRYVTTLLAADGSALVVAIVWGTQQVREARGAVASAYLTRRRARGARALEAHLPEDHGLTLDAPVSLGAPSLLARDYERSCLAWRRWPVDALPSDEALGAVLVMLAQALSRWLSDEAQGVASSADEPGAP